MICQLKKRNSNLTKRELTDYFSALKNLIKTMQYDLREFWPWVQDNFTNFFINMALVSYFLKKGTQNTSKRNSFVSNCLGEIKKLLFASVDRFRDRLVSFCGKASGVNCPVARSFVVEAKFLDFALFKVNGLLLS